MKKLIFLILCSHSTYCFSQTTHAVTVAVNQPPVCTVVSLEKTVTEPPSVYPNPAREVIQVSANAKNPIIEIFDALGRRVYRRAFVDERNTINVNEFNRGIYRLAILTQTEIHHVKIILE
ncbi:MAG TPA: T9SS type A sorting domain-containing protein [Chryseosolibacter sp.]